MKHLSTRWRIVLVVAALALLVVWRLRPTRLPVDTVRVTEGPLRETIDEEGETRVHDRFIVAAPVSGRLTRVRFRAGDSVGGGDIIAWLTPAPLDSRARQQATATLEAAEDAHRSAEATVGVARSALDQAERDRARAESLAVAGHVSPAQREAAELVAQTRLRESDAATARAATAAHDVERARAALVAATGSDAASGAGMPLRAPTAGRILRLLEESERVVLAGTPVVELGDPGRLEIQADLLTTDAVKVRAGDTVLIEPTPGATPLRGRVRTVEPSAFTKVSALGVEEQRVPVIADLLDPPGALGDRYRVEVKVVVWGTARTRKIPLSALVRRGEGWAVFAVRDGRARSQAVTLGHRGALEAELLDGLAPGDVIIRYPNDQIRDGTRVEGTAAGGV